MSTQDTGKFCPQCLASGKGQFSLQLYEVTSGGLNPDGTEQEPFHEMCYRCSNCGGIYYDVPKGVAR